MKINKTLSIVTLALLLMTLTMATSFAIEGSWGEIIHSPSSNDNYYPNDKPTGDAEPIVIENMVMEDESITNYLGIGYVATLIGENKTYIIKLYESDVDTILKLTNNQPIGKTIYVQLEHDDFEEKWDGDNFYYIESFFDKNGNYIHA